MPTLHRLEALTYGLPTPSSFLLLVGPHPHSLALRRSKTRYPRAGRRRARRRGAALAAAPVLARTGAPEAGHPDARRRARSWAPLPTPTTRPTPMPTCRRSRRSLPPRQPSRPNASGSRPGIAWSRCSPIPTSRTRRRSPSTATAGCSSSSCAATVQTPEGIDLIPPIGRISVHEDRDNDGVYEHHSVFVDKLVFPRFVTAASAPTAILTMETNADEVWKYTDTNADGVADKKELFATNFGRAGNMESQQASLFWAMDNWLYSTVNAFRLRWTPEWAPQGAHRAERRAVGRDAGQRRQGLVSGRRERDARILPVPGALRQLRAAGSVRAGPEHHVGRADSRSATSRRDCRARACRTAR